MQSCSCECSFGLEFKAGDFFTRESEGVLKGVKELSVPLEERSALLTKLPRGEVSFKELEVAAEVSFIFELRLRCELVPLKSLLLSLVSLVPPLFFVPSLFTSFIVPPPNLLESRVLACP